MKVTLAKIDKAIETFTTNRDKLMDAVDNISAMVFYHAAPAALHDDCSGSGDWSRILKLSKLMPKSWQSQLEAKLKQFTPVRLVTKNDKCEYDPAYKKLSAEDKLKAWDMEGFMSTSFRDFVEPESEKPAKTFEELVAMVASLGKRINTMAEEGRVPERDLVSAKALAERLSTFTFKRVKANNDDAPKAVVEEEVAA